MKPTMSDAKARAIVRIPDGRTGRLFALPAVKRKPGERSRGARARVLMPSGAVLGFNVDELEVVR